MFAVLTICERGKDPFRASLPTSKLKGRVTDSQRRISCLVPQSASAGRPFLAMARCKKFSIPLSIYLSIELYPSIYPSIFLSIHPAIYLSLSRPLHVSIAPAICLSIDLSTYLSIYLSFHLSIYPSIYLFIYLRIYLSAYLSVYLLNLSVYLFSPLPACLAGVRKNTSEEFLNL